MKQLSHLMLALVLATGAACKKEPSGTKEGADDDESAAAEPTPAEPTVPSLQAAKAAGAPLEITWKPPAPGQKSESVDEMRMAMKVTPPTGGEPVDMTMVERETRRTEVLEVEGDAITRVKVHYETKTEQQQMGGKTRDKPSPLQGNAYVVWMEDGAIAASAADGKPVSGEEKKELTKEWRDDLGEIPDMAKVIVSHAWKAGEPVTLSAEELANLSAEDRNVRSGTVTFQGAEGATARFLFDLVLDQLQDGETISMNMKMTMAVDTEHARPLGGEMQGSVDATVKGAKVTGTMTGTSKTTWQ